MKNNAVLTIVCLWLFFPQMGNCSANISKLKVEEPDTVWFFVAFDPSARIREVSHEIFYSSPFLYSLCDKDTLMSLKDYSGNVIILSTVDFPDYQKTLEAQIPQIDNSNIFYQLYNSLDMNAVLVRRLTLPPFELHGRVNGFHTNPLVISYSCFWLQAVVQPIDKYRFPILNIEKQKAEDPSIIWVNPTFYLVTEIISIKEKPPENRLDCK